MKCQITDLKGNLCIHVYKIKKGTSSCRNRDPRQKPAVPLTQLYSPHGNTSHPRSCAQYSVFLMWGSPELGYCEFAVVVTRSTLKFNGSMTV